LGNVVLVAENTRTAWGWTGSEQLVRDAGYGLRQIRRKGDWALLALMLACGLRRQEVMVLIWDHPQQHKVR